MLGVQDLGKLSVFLLHNTHSTKPARKSTVVQCYICQCTMEAHAGPTQSPTSSRFQLLLCTAVPWKCRRYLYSLDRLLAKLQDSGDTGAVPSAPSFKLSHQKTSNSDTANLTAASSCFDSTAFSFDYRSKQCWWPWCAYCKPTRDKQFMQWHIMYHFW